MHSLFYFKCLYIRAQSLTWTVGHVLAEAVGDRSIIHILLSILFLKNMLVRFLTTLNLRFRFILLFFFLTLYFYFLLKAFYIMARQSELNVLLLQAFYNIQFYSINFSSLSSLPQVFKKMNPQESQKS